MFPLKIWILSMRDFITDDGSVHWLVSLFKKTILEEEIV